MLKQSWGQVSELQLKNQKSEFRSQNSPRHPEPRRRMVFKKWGSRKVLALTPEGCEGRREPHGKCKSQLHAQIFEVASDSVGPLRDLHLFFHDWVLCNSRIHCYQCIAVFSAFQFAKHGFSMWVKQAYRGRSEINAIENQPIIGCTWDNICHNWALLAVRV